MEGCGFVFLALLILGFVGLLALGGHLLNRGERERFRATCAAVADKLGGAVGPGSLFDGLSICFTTHGRTAHFIFGREDDGAPAATSVEVDLRGQSPGTLKIAHESWRGTLTRMYGAQDIQIGEPGFDANYIIKAAPESLAHQIFRPERRARVIAAVRRLGRLGLPYIDLSRERLWVGVEQPLRDETSLLQVAQTAVDFVGFILDAVPTAGILWIEESKSAGGQCQVCGSEMTEGVVFCARCKTPHHEECWRYTGECSTFACKETSYIADGRVVRPAARRQKPDEWLRNEIERDRRVMTQREIDEAVRRFGAGQRDHSE